MEIYSLTCNRLERPVGIDEKDIYFSYKLKSGRPGDRQSSYRIVVFESDAAHSLMWDSRTVASDRTVQIKYEGKPLKNKTGYCWKVYVADASERVWESETQYFETAYICGEGGPSGKWITKEYVEVLSDDQGGYGLPAPYFRKEFTLTKKVKRARAYVCGLGYHKLTVNGMEATDTMLNPAFTRYDKTALYLTYDLDQLVKTGENCVGVVLGDGWYNCYIRDNWLFKYAAWRDTAKLLLEIDIEHEDGSHTILGSDSSFRVSEGPIVYDSIRNGEYYDARKEMPGWDRAGYDDAGWNASSITKAPGGRLRSQQMTPIRAVEELKPVVFRRNERGRYFADFGKNITGVCRIRVSGRAGTEIVIRYSEHKSKDEEYAVDQESVSCYTYEGEFQTDKYILGGMGEEEYHASFTYHGFRYAEMEIIGDDPDELEVEALVIHTDLPKRGTFRCSDEILNKIYEASCQSVRTNYHSIPTDCPHREKNGWTGDAQVSAEQALYNFDMSSAYYKWLNDFLDAQRPSGQIPGIIPSSDWGYNWGSGPAWDSALILIPWYMYLYDGDRAVLEHMYPAMRRYMQFMQSMSENGMVCFGLGDWCPPPRQNPEDKECEVSLTDTAYYYSNACIMQKIAGLLGYSDDTYEYERMALNSREAFIRAFCRLGEDGIMGLYEEGQTSLAASVYQGLIKEQGEKERFLQKLCGEAERRGRHFDTGILGTKYLVNVLGDGGYSQLVYDMIVNKTFPSYRYMIDQGATTIWEVWKGTTSQNHHMFTSVIEWFYKYLCGIRLDPEAPGYRRFTVEPAFVDGIDFAETAHQSPYGEVASAWKADGDGKVCLKVSVPVGCSAVIRIPAATAEEFRRDNEALLSTDVVCSVQEACGRLMACIEVSSGTFTVYGCRPLIKAD